MPEAVYQMHARLMPLVAPLPIGTNPGPLQLPWLPVSGRLLARRGALVPGVSDLGLTDGEVRRAWAALSGAWTRDDLLPARRRQVEVDGPWRPRGHGGYRPVAIDRPGFWRPQLQGGPPRPYQAAAGRALPAITIGGGARVGGAAGQRLGRPLGLVRADPADPGPAAHRRRLLAVAPERRAPADVLVGDRAGRPADCRAAQVTAGVARPPRDVTARRAPPPPYSGRGRPPTRGLIVRPRARWDTRRVSPATPPERVTTRAEAGQVVRAEVWTDLGLPDAAPERPPFTVGAIHQPRYREPPPRRTPPAVTPEQLRAIDRDRWPVEQIPPAAEQMIGAARQFVHTPETCQRLPELAVLAGGILGHAAAPRPATPTGFRDRPPRPTPGRPRRAPARWPFPQALARLPRLRQKASGTDHLPTGWSGQRRPAAAPGPAASEDQQPTVAAA